jgi:hypothetical protein
MQPYEVFVVKFMKQWIVILLLFAASISIAACVELEVGNANIDMGDGYNAQFVPYDVEVYPPSVNDIMKLKSYGFSISSDGKELAKASMYVYPSMQSNPVPKASTDPSIMPEIMGQRIITPQTISDALGYVGYDQNKDALGTDTSNAVTGFFRFFPGARKVSDTMGESLESTIEVSGETGEAPASTQSLQVFNSLLNSIKISGPSI